MEKRTVSQPQPQPKKPVEKLPAADLFARPMKSLRVTRSGNNRYNVFEVQFSGTGAPKVIPLREGVAWVIAHDEAKLWYANFLGVNGLGDSGLE